ncbi:MAG: transcriptional repressor [Tannerella sp.]|jgi:Fur family peroxide stress response transcriptional regulator|nr:transcriptional repressor [Tannerella sp.]
MNIAEKIRSKGIKATPQRQLVYEVLEGLGHAPIDEITRKVRAANPCITVATVYRILDSFQEAGLISYLNHPNGKSYYDITPDVHHHIYMDNNEILDYTDEELTELIKKRLQTGKFKDLAIEQVSVQIFAKNKPQK